LRSCGLLPHDWRRANRADEMLLRPLASVAAFPVSGSGGEFRREMERNLPTESVGMWTFANAAPPTSSAYPSKGKFISSRYVEFVHLVPSLLLCPNSLPELDARIWEPELSGADFCSADFVRAWSCLHRKLLRVKLEQVGSSFHRCRTRLVPGAV